MCWGERSTGTRVSEGERGGGVVEGEREGVEGEREEVGEIAEL